MDPTISARTVHDKDPVSLNAAVQSTAAPMSLPRMDTRSTPLFAGVIAVVIVAGDDCPVLLLFVTAVTSCGVVLSRPLKALIPPIKRPLDVEISSDVSDPDALFLMATPRLWESLEFLMFAISVKLVGHVNVPVAESLTAHAMRTSLAVALNEIVSGLFLTLLVQVVRCAMSIVLVEVG